MEVTMTKSVFGHLKTGEEVTLYRFTNTTGAYVEILNYGGIVKKVMVPDKEKTLVDVAVGFDDLQRYEQLDCPPGAVVSMSGCQDRTAFAHALWEEVECSNNAVTFFRRFRCEPDGGDLDVFIRYLWVDYERLVLDIAARCDRETEVNLTSNCLFRLDHGDDLSAHEWRTFGEWEETTEGTLIPIEETPFGNNVFTPAVLGEKRFFVAKSAEIRPLAEVISPVSELSLSAYSDICGIALEVTEDPEPGVRLQQMFSAVSGKEQTLLKPGEEWKHRIIFGFDRIYKG
ncbi:MAG: hypothetical protein IKW92_05590 [Firmicutes bacterium]|nr:hypothetical protein [Bacillota bacterium]